MVPPNAQAELKHPRFMYSPKAQGTYYSHSLKVELLGKG